MKKLCQCGKIATWEYMPGSDHYCFCDNCVPRGCSCMLDFETDEPLLDSKGRELPCCEYDYNEFGVDEFDEDDYDRFLRQHPELEDYDE